MLHLRWLSFLACLLGLLSGPLSGTLSAQDEAKALAAFQKAFKAGKVVVPVAERQSALQAIQGLDGKKPAEALIEACEATDEELARTDAERATIAEEITRLVRGQETAESRNLPQADFAKYNALKEQMGRLREHADALRGLHQELLTAVQKLRDKEALRHLLRNVAGNKKQPLPLKIAAARAAGFGAQDVMDDLAEALKRAREPEEQVALLDGVALAGPVAKLHGDLVIGLLDHKEEAVRERAALALARIALPTAVEPMIKLLGRSSGQTALRIASALEVLTGEQHGANVGAWFAWWQSEGPKVLAGERDLGKGIPSHRKTTDKNYYFGIPQDQSQGILYVLDCSGSMKAPVDFKVEQGTTAAGGSQDTKTTRLEACKKELIQALQRLRPEQKFGVLYYNDLPFLWQPKMLPATKENVAQAVAAVQKLQPAQSTNIHDSLEMGFGLVGRGSKDKYYGVELDTIFLLTDGSPTTPDGKLDSTEKIIAGVRSWNVLKRITIHCIGIGKGLNEPFLSQLASENGGEFKKF